MLSQDTIAEILGCSRDLLQTDRYNGLFKEGRARRKLSLVEAMWHKALVERDTKMQIWLSKQHLGYKDTMPESAANATFNIIIKEILR